MALKHTLKIIRKMRSKMNQKSMKIRVKLKEMMITNLKQQNLKTLKIFSKKRRKKSPEKPDLWIRKAFKIQFW
jgi:hypothetical protein